MDGTKIGAGTPPTTTPAADTSAPAADASQQSSDLMKMRGPSQGAAGPSQKDTFEDGKKHIDLFPQDVLNRAATLSPQQTVNAHLNSLKNATSSSERAGALRDLRQYLSTLPPGEQAKVLTDPKVKSTIQEVIKDPKSPAAGMLKGLLKGTIGDVIKGLQAVQPDVGVDLQKMKITNAGVKIDVPKLLNLIKKDYGDIL